MRYKVQTFSVSLDGVWDKETKDFVKNPKSGRKKLFYYSANARKLAEKLNKENAEKTEPKA